MPTVTEWSHCF